MKKSDPYQAPRLIGAVVPADKAGLLDPEFIAGEFNQLHTLRQLTVVMVLRGPGLDWVEGWWPAFPDSSMPMGPGSAYARALADFQAAARSTVVRS